MKTNKTLHLRIPSVVPLLLLTNHQQRGVNFGYLNSTCLKKAEKTQPKTKTSQKCVIIYAQTISTGKYMVSFRRFPHQTLTHNQTFIYFRPLVSGKYNCIHAANLVNNACKNLTHKNQPKQLALLIVHCMSDYCISYIMNIMTCSSVIFY